MPFFSIVTISEFSFGAEKVGAASPLAILSSFSEANSGSKSPFIVVSHSGKFQSNGSSTRVTPIATASPIARTTPPAIIKFLFNYFLPR